MTMRVIGIVPMERISEDVLRWVVREVERVFGWPVRIMGCREVPCAAFIEKREQYYSHRLLRGLVEASWPNPEEHYPKILGITGVDLATPVLTFVFGEAQLGGRFGLLSLARLEEGFYGRPENGSLLMARAAKEAVHELGHMFGMVHCTFERCVMYFSPNLRDVDDKNVDFCSVCWPILSQRVEVT
jgi:archaemetzincin